MEQPARVPLWFMIANMLLLLAAFVVGLQLGAGGARLPEPEVTALRLVHNEVLRSHVDEHDPGELLTAAIQGMVKSLDRYSQYVPPANAEEFDTDTTGTYKGIGVLLTRDTERVTIHFPLLGGPAEDADLHVGDEILAIDGEDMTGLPREKANDEAVARLKGDERQAVVLTIARGEGAPFDVEVRRGSVQTPSVKWARLLDAERRLGYLYVADFHTETVAEFESAVAWLESQAGGPLAGLVLDLRFNRGGLLDTCVDLVRRFVADGNIVTLKRRGEEIGRHDAEPKLCSLPDLPLVVLVNAVSASASEVMAGALQDHGRAVLVGERTFGKGVVNNIVRWKGCEFRLKLTTSHYYTPNGRNIEKRHRDRRDGAAKGGIAPDRTVSVEEAVEGEILHRLRRYEVPQKYRAAVIALGERLGIPWVDPLPPERDPQLAAALEELRGL